MSKLLDVVSGYGIEASPVSTERACLYACTWTASGMQFYLDFGWKQTGSFQPCESCEMPVVYVMELSEVSEVAIQEMENFNIPNGHLIVYDPEEDIQMFSKDLWNLLVSLNGGSKA